MSVVCLTVIFIVKRDTPFVSGVVVCPLGEHEREMTDNMREQRK